MSKHELPVPKLYHLAWGYNHDAEGLEIAGFQQPLLFPRLGDLANLFYFAKTYFLICNMVIIIVSASDHYCFE